MIMDLHRQGLSISAIARQLTMDRKTVRKYLSPAEVAGMVPGGLVDLTLEVTSPESPAPYTAHTRLAFSTPQRRAMLSTPGTQLPVRIDPATPTHVVIDTSELKFDAPEF